MTCHCRSYTEITLRLLALFLSFVQIVSYTLRRPHKITHERIDNDIAIVTLNFERPSLPLPSSVYVLALIFHRTTLHAPSTTTSTIMCPWSFSRGHFHGSCITFSTCSGQPCSKPSTSTTETIQLPTPLTTTHRQPTATVLVVVVVVVVVVWFVCVHSLFVQALERCDFAPSINLSSRRLDIRKVRLRITYDARAERTSCEKCSGCLSPTNVRYLSACTCLSVCLSVCRLVYLSAARVSTEH